LRAGGSWQERTKSPTSLSSSEEPNEAKAGSDRKEACGSRSIVERGERRARTADSEAESSGEAGEDGLTELGGGGRSGGEEPTGPASEPRPPIAGLLASNGNSRAGGL
jgi:hypothetical protein